MVFIPGEEHSVWGSFFSDGAARTLFSSQDFATQVLKWLICVLWHTICLRSVSFQKTLGLNRTAHRNAFITTVFKRTGGPLLIDDFKGFFFSFLAFFFYQQMISVCFLKGLLCEPSARESRDVKTEPRASSGSPNSERLKKKMKLRDTDCTFTDTLSFPFFLFCENLFFSFLHNCVWLCIYFIHFQSRRLFE